MVSALQSVFTSVSNRRASMGVLQPVPVRFGSQFLDFAPVATGLDQVYAETDFFKSSAAPPVKPVTTDSNKNISTIMTWRLLPGPVRRSLKPVLESLPAPTFKEKIMSGKVLILEEGADTWYEAVGAMLQQEGLLSDTDSTFRKTQQALTRLKGSAGQGRVYFPSDKDIMGVAQTVAKSIPEDQLRAAAQLIFQPQSHWFSPVLGPKPTARDMDQTRTLLTLTYIRMATLREENKYQHLAQYLREQWKGEFQELREATHGKERRLKKQLGRLISRHADVPQNLSEVRPVRRDFKRIQQLLTQILSRTIGKTVTPQDLYQQYLYKHTVRQSIRLKTLNDPHMGYDVRKKLSKRVEAALIAAMLKAIGSRSLGSAEEAPYTLEGHKPFPLA